MNHYLIWIDCETHKYSINLKFINFYKYQYIVFFKLTNPSLAVCWFVNEVSLNKKMPNIYKLLTIDLIMDFE